MMNSMSLDIIVQVLLAVHTLVLYPVLKFVFSIERRLTIIETMDKLNHKK